MVRRSVVLGVLGGMVLPVAALAAMTRSSEVLRSLNWADIPNRYSVEMHGGSEGAFISAWAKGTHQGSTPMTMKGEGVLTVDMANPTEGINMRFRTEFRYLDGMIYFKPSMSGTAEDQLIVMNGNVQTKQWGYIELPEEFSMETNAGLDSTIGEALRLNGIVITDREVEAALNELIDNMFVLTFSGNEYSIAFKQNSADEIMAHMMIFLGRITGDPETMAGFAPSASEMAAMRELLNSINLHVRVRLDAQNAPTFLKMYMAGETPDGWASMQGTAEKLWSPLTVTAPAGAVNPENFFNIFDNLDGLFDIEDLLPAGMSADTVWEDEFPDMMEDGMTWTDIEGQTWDVDTYDSSMMDAGDCAADSVKRLQMLRKGLVCDRQVRSRRHLQR